MDAVNLTILVAGVLLFFSIIATQLSVRSGAPILLVFLLLGMLAGEDGILGIQFNNPDVALLIGSVALIVILFDGGLRTQPERFRVALGPAAVLASLGVIITCIITGIGAAYLFGLSWVEGLLLGAILGSTDAAAVFSIFQSQGLRIKERVSATLEIESGSNDPMAVMLTITLVSILASPDLGFSWLAVLSLIQQAVVGATLGYLGGRAFVKVSRMVHIHASFFPLLAVGGSILTYGLTSELGGSGFLAVYLMGYIVGNAPKLPQVHNILRVHDGLAWLSQIVMFLMLGLLMTPSNLLDIAIPALLLAAVLILVARPVAVLISLAPFHFPWRDRIFIAWVGLRGAVPIVLALFPWIAGLENQALYFEIAFFIVLVSLIVQGWSILPFARKLGLEVPPEAEPNSRTPLESVTTKNAILEIATFEIEDDTPACDLYWNDISIHEPVEFMGLIRKGEWLRTIANPKLQAGDTVLVLTRSEDIPRISDVLASNGTGKRLTKKTFFGDFVLNADSTVADLSQFYVLPETNVKPEDTIAGLFSHQFRRRVVVGDHIVIGSLMLTARDVAEDGTIRKVGVKAAVV